MLEIWENRIGRPTLREHTSYHTVNPAKAQVVAQGRVGDNVFLSRAPGLGEDADAWWYYLESEGKPAASIRRVLIRRWQMRCI